MLTKKLILKIWLSKLISKNITLLWKLGLNCFRKEAFSGALFLSRKIKSRIWKSTRHLVKRILLQYEMTGLWQNLNGIRTWKRDQPFRAWLVSSIGVTQQRSLALSFLDTAGANRLNSVERRIVANRKKETIAGEKEPRIKKERKQAKGSSEELYKKGKWFQRSL